LVTTLLQIPVLILPITGSWGVKGKINKTHLILDGLVSGV